MSWSFNAAFLLFQEACQGGTNVTNVQEYCIDGYEGPSKSPFLHGRGVYLPLLLVSFRPTVLGSHGAKAMIQSMRLVGVAPKLPDAAQLINCSYTLTKRH